jgi:hypothetical protein
MGYECRFGRPPGFLDSKAPKWSDSRQPSTGENMVATAPRQFVSIRELQLDGVTYALGVECSDDGFCGSWGCETCGAVAQEPSGDATRGAAERRARTHLVAHHALFHLASIVRLGNEPNELATTS